MRRGPGLAGLQQDALKREQYKQIGDEVKNSNLEAMKQQMSLFKSKLEEFARKHKADIRRDPELRARFHQMCANIGVDPLASNKGLWTHALGFGDFYYELGVQIVEACLASRSADGGLLELGVLTRAVNRRRGGQVDPVTSDDVVRAIKALKCLGGGFTLVAIGTLQYVRSVPGELNLDKNKVLELAQSKGYVSQGQITATLGWTRRRCTEVLQDLLAEGLALVDDGPPNTPSERLFWFPCLSTQSASL